MEIIDGQAIAQEIKKKLKKELLGKKQPGLAIILIGADPASRLYLKQKAKAAKELGVLFCPYLFSANCYQQDVYDTIAWLNQDDQINGILIQLPLPTGWDSTEIIQAIDDQKDVDGLKNNKITPPFIAAIIQALRATKIELPSKKILTLVNSDLFGKKLVSALKKKGWPAEYIKSTKIFRHSALDAESSLPADKLLDFRFRGNDKMLKKTKQADVLISACGQPKMIKAQDIKPDAVLIDGGISQVKGRTIGDIDQKSVVAKAKMLCPVPGGLGPITVAMLYRNLVKITN